METLLTTNEAANRIGLSPQTLRSMRMRGSGPVFVRLSANRVAYAPSDVAAWVSGRRRQSTREAASQTGLRGAA